MVCEYGVKFSLNDSSFVVGESESICEDSSIWGNKDNQPLVFSTEEEALDFKTEVINQADNIIHRLDESEGIPIMDLFAESKSSVVLDIVLAKLCSDHWSIEVFEMVDKGMGITY